MEEVGKTKIQTSIYKKFLVLLIPFWLFACSSSDSEFDKKISQAFKECKDKNVCLANFNELFSFKWSYLTVLSLNSNRSHTQIADIIKVPYDKELNEFSRVIIFTSEEEVVKEYISFYQPVGISPDRKPLKTEFNEQSIENMPRDQAIFLLKKTDKGNYKLFLEKEK